MRHQRVLKKIASEFFQRQLIIYCKQITYFQLRMALWRANLVRLSCFQATRSLVIQRLKLGTATSLPGNENSFAGSETRYGGQLVNRRREKLCDLWNSAWLSCFQAIWIISFRRVKLDVVAIVFPGNKINYLNVRNSVWLSCFQAVWIVFVTGETGYGYLGLQEWAVCFVWHLVISINFYAQCASLTP